MFSQAYISHPVDIRGGGVEVVGISGPRSLLGEVVSKAVGIPTLSPPDTYPHQY